MLATGKTASLAVLYVFKTDTQTAILISQKGVISVSAGLTFAAQRA